MKIKTLWEELLRRNKLLAYTGLGFLLLFVILAATAASDSTTILGVNRWIKPMKFAISITIFLWTMGWLMEHLKAARGKVMVISLGMVATMVAEIIPIVGQAARNKTSHFNNATAFDSAVFTLMGIMIVINTLFVVYALYLFFKTPADVSPAYLWGIRLGLLIFVLAGAEGGVMAAMLRHSIGAPDGGPGLPFINWSTRAGDLRVAHFIGLHALQVLPVTGYVLDQLSRRYPAFRPPSRPVGLIMIIAATYFAVVTLTFVWAMMGRPLIALN